MAIQIDNGGRRVSDCQGERFELFHVKHYQNVARAEAPPAMVCSSCDRERPLVLFPKTGTGQYSSTCQACTTKRIEAQERDAALRGFRKRLKLGTRWRCAALGALLLALVPQPAPAQDMDTRWATQRFCARYAWDGSCLRYRYQRRHIYRPAYRGPESRYADLRYYAAPREDSDERRCRDIRRAVGDQHLTVDGAKKAANDSWAGTVRFHLGEKFMDLSNARSLVYTCSRSSIKEGGVTTLGQTLTRCELEARPCAPLTQEETREER